MKLISIPTLKQILDKPTDSLINQIGRGVTLSAINRFVGFKIPFSRRNHFKVITLQTGYLKAQIPLKPNRNHINSMYAGAMFTLAELPGGILSLVNFDKAFYPILKSLNMTYLKTAKSDVSIEFWLSEEEVARIQLEACEKGKAEFVLKGELKDTQGQVVATSEGHYQIRAHL